MLTDEMKQEIVNYMLGSWSKGLVEDDHACPELARAYHPEKTVTQGEIEDFVEACRLALLEKLPCACGGEGSFICGPCGGSGCDECGGLGETFCEDCPVGREKLAAWEKFHPEAAT